MLTLGDSPTHSRGHTKGTASFPDPTCMRGRMGKGCSALCQSLFPLQHLQLGTSRARQGRAGQGKEAAVRGWFPLPSSHSLFVQQRLLQHPGQLFLQSARRRLKPPCSADMSSKGIIKKKKQPNQNSNNNNKIQQREENIQSAPRHKVSLALSTVPMALWLHPSQSRGSPHRQAGGEADLLLAAQKLFLVEGSPKRREFQPRAVYFLYFCRFHLWFRGIQTQLEPLPFTCQSPAQPHQDPLPRDICPKTPQRQKALPCTSSLHQGEAQGQELPGKCLWRTDSHCQSQMHIPEPS